MCFSSPGLLPWRTVEQNLRLGVTARSGRHNHHARTAHRDGALGFPPRISRAAFARHVEARRTGARLAVEPTLLLLDEPFVSLDEATADRLRQLLLNIWQQRPATVLFVTHDSREAAMLADRVILMTPSPGTIQADIRLDMPRAQRTGSALAALRHRILDRDVPSLFGQVD